MKINRLQIVQRPRKRVFRHLLPISFRGEVLNQSSARTTLLNSFSVGWEYCFQLSFARMFLGLSLFLEKDELSPIEFVRVSA
jgi:hypothetical protein